MAEVIAVLFVVAVLVAVYFAGRQDGAGRVKMDYFDGVWDAGFESCKRLRRGHEKEVWEAGREYGRLEESARQRETHKDFVSLRNECRGAHLPGDCPLCGAA